MGAFLAQLLAPLFQAIVGAVTAHFTGPSVKSVSDADTQLSSMLPEPPSPDQLVGQFKDLLNQGRSGAVG